MNKPKDMTGERHKNFTVIEFAGMGSNYKSMWRCRCDCGREVIADRHSIISGKVRKCECQKFATTTSDKAIAGMQQKIERDNVKQFGTKYACNKHDYCIYCGTRSDYPCASAKLHINKLRKIHLLARDIAEPYIVGQY